MKGSKTAITEYERLAYRGGLSLVKCRLITGRTHQIRSQMAHVGHPLLGDDKYGVKTTNRSYKENASFSARLRSAVTSGKRQGPSPTSPAPGGAWGTWDL